MESDRLTGDRIFNGIHVGLGGQLVIDIQCVFLPFRLSAHLILIGGDVGLGGHVMNIQGVFLLFRLRGDPILIGGYVGLGGHGMNI